MSEAVPRSTGNAKPYILFGLAIVLSMFGGLGAWAAMAELSGAVIGSGVIAVSNKRQTVQHLEGGIVADLLVRDNQVVEAGQLLVRLDDTRARANLRIIEGRLDLLYAQAARLRAEREGAPAMGIPIALIERMSDATVSDIVEGQIELFKTRRSALNGETEILTQRTTQLNEQTQGIEAQQAAKVRQIELITEELEGLQQLFRQGYAPRTRILELEREAERLRGEAGEHIAEIARINTQIGETELQIIQLQRAREEQATEQLRETQAQVFDLEQRRVAAMDEMRRLEIHAPKAGSVVGLSVHTVGGVISPGQPVMDIVPQEDELIVEAQIAPQDIDKIAGGSVAVVRLSAFDLRTTPELNGTVLSMSADRLIDETTGMPYYLVRVRIPEIELARLDGLSLLPGMPAEVFINTGQRSALSYLVKPLTDSLAHVFRED